MEKLKIKNFPFTSILGWSFSRYDTFTQCKRRYYYQYYAKFDPEYSRNKIDSLKALTSIPLEIGNIAHDIIKGVLERLKRTLEPIDMVRFEKHVEKIIISKLTKNFFEIYYRQQEKIDINEIFPKTIESLNNLFESSRFEWIKEKAIPSKDQWLIEPSKYGESRMGDLKLYCKVDFLLQIEPLHESAHGNFLQYCPFVP